VINPAVHRLGFTGRNAAIADSFLRALQHQGRTEGEGLKLLAWYGQTFGPNAKVSAADAAIAFEYAATRNNWDEALVEAGFTWHSHVHSNGGNPESVAALGAPDASRIDARLAQIRAYRKNNFDAYEANQAMQDEELRLLAAKQGGGRAPGYAPPAYAGTPANTPQPHGNAGLVEAPRPALTYDNGD
jgi:hypothetical protein